MTEDCGHSKRNQRCTFTLGMRRIRLREWITPACISILQKKKKRNRKINGRPPTIVKRRSSMVVNTGPGDPPAPLFNFYFIFLSLERNQLFSTDSFTHLLLYNKKKKAITRLPPPPPPVVGQLRPFPLCDRRSEISPQPFLR